MSYESDRPLMKALVTALNFIDTGDEGFIHPDYAVKIMENVSSVLGEVSPERLRELHNEFQLLAEEYEDLDMQAFVRETFSLMGLLDKFEA